MIQRVRTFWATAYRADPVSFIIEMIGFTFIVGASLMLSFTADKPNMSYIYPAYFVGNICAIFAYTRRKLAWQLTSASYFFCINIFGFGRALGAW
jgi:hypothetical protein